MTPIRLPKEQLLSAVKALINEGHTTTIRIRGFSMRPFLEDARDSVIIAPVTADGITVGDVVLAEVAPDYYVLHRVATRNGHLLVLRGDGNVAQTEACPIGAVIGRATCFLRGKHQRPCTTTSRRWRIYSRLWPSSPFLRRCLLAFHRRIIVPLHLNALFL